MSKESRIAFLLVAALLGGPGCQSAARKVMYSAYETIGTEKRDLLKKRVGSARDAQEDTSAEFKDALTHLSELYGFEGGELEKIYNEVSDDYEDVQESADRVHDSIQEMDQVANDLFDEWEGEIAQISTKSYQAESRRQLAETRGRYAEVHTALERAEKSMKPALVKLKDQVLFLKHNLNARAIDSLKAKGTSLRADIDRVIQEATASIKKAEGFIQSMSDEKSKG